MDKLVILELEGDFQQTGFKVTLDIRNDQGSTALKAKGRLPIAPEMAQHLHHHWNEAYRSLGLMGRLKEQKTTYQGSSNQRIVDCRRSAIELIDCFQDWLSASSFQTVDRRLRESLDRADTIRFLIRSDDLDVQRLPWSEWDFFERYPRAELALGASEFEAPFLLQTPFPEAHKARATGSKVRILAILGHRQGIDLETDRQILENLPHAQVEFLVEPSREEMSDRLWEQPWDILFFAGHSETDGESGRICINPTDSLTLSELKYGLQKAIHHGLQLAIFNSCNGLGLVRELQSLAIAQMIVMREPITDKVAQAFLRYFLHAFSQGESFYLATRYARERLESLEGTYPCASWLPIIYQHPLAIPPTWARLRGDVPPSQSLITPPYSKTVRTSHHVPAAKLVRLVGMITFAIMLLRFSGIMQGLELVAYDRLIRARPAETIDDRILVVEVTQEDLNQYGGYPLPDQALANAVQTLQKHNPVAIAIDMHRYQPRGVGRDAFVRQFGAQPNLLLACAFNDPDQVADPDHGPPPEFSDNQRWEQMGFSNLPVDESTSLFGSITKTSALPQDLPVRRQLLSYSPELATTPSSCSTPYSLSFQLVYRFLAHRGIEPLQVNASGNWQLGRIEISPLSQRFGGYQFLDGYSDQIMLNPRTAAPGQRVALVDVLQGNIGPAMVSDRVILIGYEAPIARDQIPTPTGQISGVWVHAHMTSQLLSAVLEQRPLIWVLPQWQNIQWGDGLWVLSWSLVAGSIVYVLRNRFLWLVGAMALIVITAYYVSLMILAQGGWLPIIPTVCSVMAVGIGVVLHSDR
ncbi:MAG: CHASE2 domain-containing protein [Cyanobacteria bacterium P01_F01_bin.150]